MSSVTALPNINAVDNWLKSPIGAACSRMAINGMYLFPCHGVTSDLKCTCGHDDCKNIGKHPACANGLLDATNDIVKLAELFRYRNDLNIGFVTGEKNKLIIVDVDGGKGGFESLAKLEEKYGELPNSPISITGNGQHRFFNMPIEKIKSKSNALGTEYPGIDVRNSGGYIIAPGSTHASGRKYHWMPEMAEETPDMPAWLIDLLKEKPKTIRPIMHDYSQGQLSEWSKDEVWRMLECIDYNIPRSEWIKVGFALHEGGYSCEMWASWSTPGRTYIEGECEKCWRGFGKTMDGVTMGTLYDMARIGGYKPKEHERPPVDTALVDNLVAKIGGGKVKEIPIFDFGFNPLDLPGLVGDTVRAIVKYALQPQPELALFNTLSALGAVFGRRYASPINTRTNLYMIGIARTAAGKDHSRSYISEIAEKADLMKYIGAQYIRSDTAMLCDVQDKPSNLMMIDEIGMYLEAVSNPHAPAHIRNVSSALTRLYTSSGSFYDHGQTADRKVKAIKIQRPNLCIYGTTTEKNYAKALRSEAIESGELNRFLVYKSDRIFTGDEVDPPKREIDQDLVDKWSEYSGTDFALADFPPEPIIVDWNDECKGLQRYYYKKQMEIVNSESRSSLLWGRYMESIVKIAMIFAIGRDKQFPAFSSEDFKTAANIVDTCLAYMAFLAEECIADSAYEEDQQKIITFLKRYKNWVPRNTLMTKMRSMERKKREDIVYDLVERGEIEESSEEARVDGSKSGRKTS